MSKNCSDAYLLDFAIDNGFVQMVQNATSENSILNLMNPNEKEQMNPTPYLILMSVLKSQCHDFASPDIPSQYY